MACSSGQSENHNQIKSFNQLVVQVNLLPIPNQLNLKSPNQIHGQPNSLIKSNPSNYGSLHSPSTSVLLFPFMWFQIYFNHPIRCVY